LNAADAAADHRPDLVFECLVIRQRRVVDCLFGCDEGVLREAVHPAREFASDQLFGIEILDLGGDPRGKGSRIKDRNRSNA